MYKRQRLLPLPPHHFPFSTNSVCFHCGFSVWFSSAFILILSRLLFVCKTRSSSNASLTSALTSSGANFRCYSCICGSFIASVMFHSWVCLAMQWVCSLWWIDAVGVCPLCTRLSLRRLNSERDMCVRGSCFCHRNARVWTNFNLRSVRRFVRKTVLK